MQREKNKTKIPFKLKRYIIYALSILFSFIIILYGIICWTIFLDVKKVCNKATREFKGDTIESLTELLNSDINSYEEKNDAIWALGQIGDPKALPLLEKFYTGNPCEKPCRRNQSICQREVSKAIQTCKGAFSATRWMYFSYRN